MALSWFKGVVAGAVSPKLIEADQEGFFLSFVPSALTLSKVKYLPPKRGHWDGTAWRWGKEVGDIHSLDILASQAGFTWTESGLLMRARCINEHEERSEMSRGHGDDEWPESPVPGLYGYQKVAAKYLIERKRALLGSIVGSGKTVTTLAAVEAQGAYPCLVVCPASVKYVWEKEVAKWGIPRTVKQVKGRALKPGDYDADIIVINYELLNGRKDSLKAVAWASIICDEGHRVKDYRTQMSRALNEIVKEVKPEVRYAMSGTFIPNRLPELVNPLIIIDRLNDLGGYNNLRSQHMVFNKKPWGDSYVGCKNVPQLHDSLRKTCYMRHDDEVVGLNRPDMTRIMTPVEITNRKEYNRANREFEQWWQEKKEQEGGITPQLKNEALVKLGALRGLSAIGKLKAVNEWIADLDPDDKVVIFAYHKNVIAAIKERWGDECVTITGDVPSGKRQDIVEQFKGKARILAATIGTMGTGVDGLQEVSHIMGFVELDWTPSNHEQAEGRLRRTGQGKKVTAHYFIGDKTVDEKTWAILNSKSNESGLVLDGKATGFKFDEAMGLV